MKIIIKWNSLQNKSLVLLNSNDVVCALCKKEEESTNHMFFLVSIHINYGAFVTNG
jgi:hypothetical protein